MGRFLKKVRAWVYPRARRHFVLFDAHAGSQGMMVGERSLLDFNSYPLRIKEVPEEPMRCVLEKGHLNAIFGKSPACVTPSGWRCDALPYLVEFDNFGVSDHPGVADLNDHYVWGYDEITWFYSRMSPRAGHGCAMPMTGCTKTIRTAISRCRCARRIAHGRRAGIPEPSRRQKRQGSLRHGHRTDHQRVVERRIARISLDPE